VDKISMEEIAREADYGKGSLYNYFSSKNDLLWCLIHRTLDNFLQSNTRELEKVRTFKLKIRKVIEISINLLESDPTIFELWDYIEMNLQTGRNTAVEKERLAGILSFLQFFADLFEDAMRTGELRKNDPMMLSIIMFSMIRSVYKSGKLGIITCSQEEKAEFILDLFFNQP
ncbi:TetR/AcrR family transcriptional regulator, partial [Fibrobacterota bacterium]